MFFFLSLRSAEAGEVERNLFSFTFVTCLSASVLHFITVFAQQDAAQIPAMHAHCGLLHCLLDAIDKWVIKALVIILQEQEHNFISI